MMMMNAAAANDFDVVFFPSLSLSLRSNEIVCRETENMRLWIFEHCPIASNISKNKSNGGRAKRKTTKDKKWKVPDWESKNIGWRCDWCLGASVYYFSEWTPKSYQCNFCDSIKSMMLNGIHQSSSFLFFLLLLPKHHTVLAHSSFHTQFRLYIILYASGVTLSMKSLKSHIEWHQRAIKSWTKCEKNDSTTATTK